MSRRRWLWLALSGTAFLGLVILGLLFGRSLQPNTKNEANRDRVPIPDIEVEAFALVDYPYSIQSCSDWSEQILVLRTEVDSYALWLFPTIDGELFVPEKPWHGPYFPCGQLTVDFDTKRIQCENESQTNWNGTYSWDFDGITQNRNWGINDLKPLLHEIELGDFVVSGVEI